jgi:hypothetical protein
MMSSEAAPSIRWAWDGASAGQDPRQGPTPGTQVRLRRSALGLAALVAGSASAAAAPAVIASAAVTAGVGLMVATVVDHAIAPRHAPRIRGSGPSLTIRFDHHTSPLRLRLAAARHVRVMHGHDVVAELEEGRRGDRLVVYDAPSRRCDPEALGAAIGQAMLWLAARSQLREA